MKYATAILATSHIDRHNERFAPVALASMVDQINSEYIPMGVEHDPRLPPQGRVTSAELVELDDGEYAVKGNLEIFEPEDEIPFDRSRRMPVRTFDDNRLHIVRDRTYETPEDQALLEDLRDLVDGHLDEEGKKAVEPISVLAIGGAFVLGSIASGFLQKIGADAWDQFKRKLAGAIQRKRGEGREHVLMFTCAVKRDGEDISLDVYMTNPTGSDVEKFCEEGLRDMDRISWSIVAQAESVRRVVFEFSEGRLSFRFAARSDAVPMRLEPRDGRGEEDD